jgi:TRAP-type C4-dicarboxylate transport system permease small subunit
MSPASSIDVPAWFKGLRRLEAHLVRGEKVICVLALALMLFSTVLMVLARNAAMSISNYGELGLAAIVPLTLVGGALCTALGSHIVIDVIQMVPSRVVLRLAEVLVAAATLVFAYIYTSSGIQLLIEFYETGDKLLDLGTPLWVLMLFFPLGMALMAFHAVMRVLAIFVGGAEPRPGEPVA